MWTISYRSHSWQIDGVCSWGKQQETHRTRWANRTEPGPGRNLIVLLIGVIIFRVKRPFCTDTSHFHPVHMLTFSALWKAVISPEAWSDTWEDHRWEEKPLQRRSLQSGATFLQKAANRRTCCHRRPHNNLHQHEKKLIIILIIISKRQSGLIWYPFLEILFPPQNWAKMSDFRQKTYCAWIFSVYNENITWKSKCWCLDLQKV